LVVDMGDHASNGGLFHLVKWVRKHWHRHMVG